MSQDALIKNASPLNVIKSDILGYNGHNLIQLSTLIYSFLNMFPPLKPNYVVCKYNPREDLISRTIATQYAWEPKLSQRFLEIAKESGAEPNYDLYE